MIGNKLFLQCVIVRSNCEILLYADVIDKVVDHALLIEGTHHSIRVSLVHLCNDCGLINELDVTRFKARLHHVIADHRHVVSC